MSAETDLLQRMALPSLVGKYIGRQMWGVEWVAYKWLRYVEQRVLEAILDETHERYIIINAPPQTGKSSFIRLLLFWILGQFPNKNAMYISYSDEFSESSSKDVRTMVQVWGKELFGISIDPDHNKVAEWRINGHRGGLLAAGIGGLITGKPGDIICIDDLIKNAEEARSTAAKRAHLAEWDGTIARRMQPGSTVIVIATRWAEDDLSGALIERMKQPGYTGPQWETVSFPAFAEPTVEVEEELTPEELAAWRDLIGREYGEVLDCRFSNIPGRAPDDFFNIVKASTDPLAFSCLYQQRTFSAEGSMFARENWRYYGPNCAVKERPEMEQVFRVWDLAGTEAGGDFTVGTKIGRAEGKLWVIDVARFRHASGKVLTKVIETAQADGHQCGILVEEEKGGAGKSTIAALQKMLPGYNLEPAKAEGDKKSRATPYSAEQQNNRVMLPEHGSVAWDVKGFEDEHLKMMQDGRLPRHDDQIDTTAYGVLALVGHAATEIFVPGGGEPGSPEDLMNRFIAQTIGGGSYAFD